MSLNEGIPKKLKKVLEMEVHPEKDNFYVISIKRRMNEKNLSLGQVIKELELEINNSKTDDNDKEAQLQLLNNAIGFIMLEQARN